MRQESESSSPCRSNNFADSKVRLKKPIALTEARETEIEPPKVPKMLGITAQSLRTFYTTNEK